MSQGRTRALILAIIAVLVILGGVGDALLGGGSDRGTFAAAFRGSTALAPAAAISSSWYCAVATVPAAPTTSPPTVSTSADTVPAASGVADTVPAANGLAGLGSAGKGLAGLGSAGNGLVGLGLAAAVPPSAGGRVAGGPVSLITKTTKPKATPKPAPGTSAGAVIALANTGPVAVRGTVAVVGQSSVVDVAVSVPAHGKTTVSESPLVKGSDIAATVVLDGGGVAVEQLFTYGSALTVSPCASTSASTWYFASGSTAGPDQMLVSLYNPLPTSAVVDLSFATAQGVAIPSDDQGIVVPASSQVVVSVGAHVQQQSLVATTVNVLDGRVVAEEVQLDPSSGTSGVALSLGTPSAESTWALAAGLVASGTLDRLDIYNPSSQAASVRLDLALSLGSTSPIVVPVPAGSVVEVVANRQTRIPHDSLFGVNATSTNGVGVVVERSFRDQPPQTQQGLTETIGGALAKRWVIASGVPASGSKELVVVENPSSSPVLVSVTAMSGGSTEPAPSLSNKVVPAGRPITLSLGAAQLQDPLVISASGPVVVEQNLVGPGGHGVSSVLGEPAT